MKTRLFHTFLIIITFGLTVVAILSGSFFRTGIPLSVGSVSPVRIRATRDIENRLATERNREEARERAEELEPVFTINPDTWNHVENNLRRLQDELEDIRAAYRQERTGFDTVMLEWEDFIQLQISEFERVFDEWQELQEQAMQNDEPFTRLPPEAPEPPPEPIWHGVTFRMFDHVPMSFTEQQRYDLIAINDDKFDVIWDVVNFVAEYIQTQLVMDNEPTVRETFEIQRLLGTWHSVDFSYHGLIHSIVLHHLRPNAIPNEVVNRLAYEQTRQDYVTESFLENQIIVDEGDIVTEELYAVLSELGVLRPESLRESLFSILGAITLVAIFFLTNLMFLSFYRPTVANKKESLLLFTLYMLTLFLVWSIRDYQDQVPLIPLLIFPMLVSVLIDRRCATVLTFSMVFVSYFIVAGSPEFLLFYSIAGIVVCMFSRFTTERTKVILVGLLISAILFALSIAVSFITDRNYALQDIRALITTAGIASLSGILTVIICTGSLPFWETFFGVVTPVKLLDLTNPTNLLLRRLMIEAPGTYHHALIVANLAETAAYDIGANAHAARVGGYYHDVGKLKFPHYFAENLDGDNPHDHLDPINSVQLIISHVSYGLTLASEHRLPQFVRDMIKEHHGNTILQYFYVKAMESDPQADIKDYRYPFTIPQTKESACVMLADSVEAAVRSMIPKLDSIEEVQGFISNIVKGKLNDGQLADSQLSIRDVITIEKSFFRVLKGMYHERIVYKPIPTETEKKVES